MREDLRSCSGVTALLAALAIAVLLPASTDARDVTANIDSFCMERYGAETVSGVDRRDNNPLYTQKTDQGLGMLHHRVDAAEICPSRHPRNQ